MSKNDAFRETIIRVLGKIERRAVSHDEEWAMEQEQIPLLSTVTETSELWSEYHVRSIGRFLTMVGYELEDTELLGHCSLLEKKLDAVEKRGSQENVWATIDGTCK